MTTYLTIERAAQALQLSPEALRARCRRAARRKGKDIVAELGDGIVAVKFGRSWRIRFPGHATPGDASARSAAMGGHHGS